MATFGSKIKELLRLLSGRGAKRRLEVARKLADYDDVRAVGPLAEALGPGDRQVREIAAAALTRLLPRLRPADAGLLNGNQRRCLYRALNGENTDLILAILKAFEAVGDDAALPHVERLASGRGRAAKSLPIQRAAQECLPFLRERLEKERGARTLLHPSTAPSVPADALRQPERDNLA
jgi:hypothetical protein